MMIRSLMIAADAAPAQIARLASGQLHELYFDAVDWGAALAFILHDMGKSHNQMDMIWVRSRPKPETPLLYGPGLQILGHDPAGFVLVEAEDMIAVLRAGLDVARSGAVGSCIISLQGRCAQYDLTASRKLLLAAEQSGCRVMLCLSDAEERPSAAQSRWRVRSAAAQPLIANAPGGPAIDVELLRRRGGPAGERWRMEWNEDDNWQETALAGAMAPALCLRAPMEASNAEQADYQHAA